MILVDVALRALSRGKLSVFVFHKVPRQRNPLVADDLDLASFRQVMDFAQTHFHILPLEEAAQALSAGRLPPRAAAITLDDGYADWMDGVVPELTQRKLPATFFITTGQLDGLPMWHERISQAVCALSGGAISLASAPILGRLPLQSPSDCVLAVARLEQHLKYQRLCDREVMLLELESIAGTSPATLPRLTSSDVRTLHNKGFTVGAHTVNHPILTRCSESEARDEIGATRETLAAITGAPVTAFAYPNGQPGVDFSEAHIRQVRAAGYTHAVTTHRGSAGRDTSLFQLPRFTPWGPSYYKHALQLARNLRTESKQLSEATQ